MEWILNWLDLVLISKSENKCLEPIQKNEVQIIINKKLHKINFILTTLLAKRQKVSDLYFNSEGLLIWKPKIFIPQFDNQ